MKCRVCGSESNHNVFPAKEMMFGLEKEFSYFECNKCACLQISVIPDDLSSYYPNDYYSYKMIKWENKLLKAALIARNKAAVFNKGLIGKVLNVIKKPSVLSSTFLSCIARQKLNTNSRIMDVGCGDGTFLLHLSEVGFSNLLGVDPYVERDITLPTGVKIRKCNLAQAEGKWDLIVFNHSFEHMSDPASVMKDVKRLLKDDGLCLIRIPVVPCYAWERYRENWVQLDAPRHLFIHSKNSMNVLAENVNMYIDDVVFDSTSFQILGSERYENIVKGVSEKQIPVLTKIKTNFRKWRANQLAKKLNENGTGDQAAFYIKPK